MRFMNILEQDLSEETTKEQKERKKGLTSSEAAEALKKYGENQLKQKKAVNPVRIFANQYKDILTLILLISTGISLFLGEYIEAIAIGTIVLMNGIMGFLQEYKTEKTLEALRKMAAPTALVCRDGKFTKVPASQVVPGDLLKVEAGDRVCADALLTEATAVAADESVLTGESQAIQKIASLTHREGNELHREDMVYMGTTVVKGHGEAKVVATGMKTQMGGIAGMLHEIKEEETQLQKKLGQLGKYIAVGCLLVCVIVSVTGVLRGEDFLDMLITGVSLAVAAVPEGLPAIVTIALALAVGRMVKQKALVRKLHAVETLGCTNVICSDKTGTLTQNHMTVTELFTVGRKTVLERGTKFPKGSCEYQMAVCGAVCNNAEADSDTGVISGEPTETALLNLCRFIDTPAHEIQRQYRRISEIPFDSRRKCMSVSAESLSGDSSSGVRFVFVKGAYDVLLGKCTHLLTSSGERLLSADYRRQITSANEEMAGRALRVIGVACKKIGSREELSEDHLVFLGLIGMIDPPRPEVKRAVELCRKAGMKTVMITGDHRITACAIAREIGIYRPGDLVLEGSELDQMSEEKLEQAAGQATVFARVSPRHKLMIVNAFQKKGNVVAMTGDGVNDAPAVKQADIGVSMGKTGTDVTREASDIVLLDDNFSTLVNAVREGRVIYSNIRKFIRYLLSCNIGEVITMFLGMLMGMPVVLLPIQILLINLVTDGLPAIALGLEPPEKDVMNDPPRKKEDGIFSDGLLSKIIFRGIFIGLSTLAAFVALYRLTGTVEAGRTGAYFTLVVTQLINVFECKSEHHTLFGIPIFSNKKLIGAVTVSLSILLLTIYLPPLQVILSTVALERNHIFLLLSFCMIPTVMSACFISGKRKKGLR